ncbi:Uncharacterised protein [Mycoplasmopsis californica]|uniref:Uncharacterized protein n=1 Tax=Mycoplasmopsis equigenitalium TaxID=114883 RepID=A0ABY5J6D3_9BACT|nr:hypothetical protein [Mycoplasmopsis equigenitalium]UUD37238.1 hypothetical protein NPA09_01550 [Mycoplasmopsis equigenitalium]VEU69454.1 Uncharacterised protein [Mycoplasmopsis californica]
MCLLSFLSSRYPLKKLSGIAIKTQPIMIKTLAHIGNGWLYVKASIAKAKGATYTIVFRFINLSNMNSICSNKIPITTAIEI